MKPAFLSRRFRAPKSLFSLLYFVVSIAVGTPAAVFAQSCPPLPTGYPNGVFEGKLLADGYGDRSLGATPPWPWMSQQPDRLAASSRSPPESWGQARSITN